MEEIVIRDATIDDAKAIRHVSKESWLCAFPNEEYRITKDDVIARFTFPSKEAEEQHTKERQQVISEDKNQHYFVVDNGNKVIGFCLVRKEKNRNILQALHILPSYQRKGIGTKLITTALEWLGREKDIELSVVVYNTKAISFYEKIGFKKNGKKITENRTVLPSGRETPQIEMVLSAK